MANYLKLAEIESFTVESISAPIFKKYEEGKGYTTVSSETFWAMAKEERQGFQKRYPATVKEGGILELSSGQIGVMLEGVMTGTSAELKGRRFNVKNNGKKGIEIRYYINPARQSDTTPAPAAKAESQELNW